MGLVWLGAVLYKLGKLRYCPNPSDQPRDAARREECSDLDEKSLTTFCSLSEEGKRSDGDRLNDFMRLKRTTQNDAPGGVVSQEYLNPDASVSCLVCPIPSTYVEAHSPVLGPAVL